MLCRSLKYLKKCVNYRFCIQQKRAELTERFDEEIFQAKLITNKIQKIKRLNDITMRYKKELEALQQNQKQDKIKSYILQTMGEQKTIKQESKAKNQHFIPNGLVVKKLFYGEKKIFFLGINQEDEDHCIYMKRMAQKLNIKNAVTALPPDMPYFIKSQGNFALQWNKFLRQPGYAKNQAKFYLNPVPRCLQDVQLKKQQINLVRNGLDKSKQFNEMMFAIYQYQPIYKKYLPNGLLTPLLVNTIKNVYFVDFPVIKEREMWAITISVDKFRELFEIYKTQRKKKQSFFDPRILFPQNVLNYKFEHIINQLKLVTYENKNDQPVLFVCPSEYTQMLSIQWPKQKQILHYFDLTPYRTKLNDDPKITFLQFVEKMAIMDVILEPVVTKYYIRYESFPFRASETIGADEHLGKIFLIWQHFYNLYSKALHK